MCPRSIDFFELIMGDIIFCLRQTLVSIFFFYDTIHQIASLMVSKMNGQYRAGLQKEHHQGRYPKTIDKRLAIRNYNVPYC